MPGHPWGPLNPVIILLARIAGTPWLDVFRPSCGTRRLSRCVPVGDIGGTDSNTVITSVAGAHPIADEFRELRAYQQTHGAAISTRVAMRKPSSFISCTHCGPDGARSTSRQSCGSIHAGGATTGPPLRSGALVLAAWAADRLEIRGMNKT